jgi:hypothetical protein
LLALLAFAPELVRHEASQKGANYVELDEMLNGTGDAMPTIILATTQHESVLEAAKVYTRSGVCVTPVIGKQPILDKWQDKLLKEDELPAHFGNGRNLGVLLGEPSGGLVDVDLDVSQAIRAADVLLPEH